MYRCLSKCVLAPGLNQTGDDGLHVLSLLTPFGILDPRIKGLHLPSGMYWGMLQLGVIAMLIVAITRRLYRPAKTPKVALAVGSS